MLRVDQKEIKIKRMQKNFNDLATDTEKKWASVNKVIARGVPFDIVRATKGIK